MTRTTRGIAIALVLAAASAPAAPAKVLVGDFVDLGPGPRGVGRREAPVTIVRLANETGVPVDVTLGEGSATLLPKQVLLARAEPGDVAVRASVREGESPLEGTLRVERGRQYALVFGWRVEGEGEAPEGTVEGKSQATGAAAAQPAAGSSVRPRREGRVDVGRRRRK